MSGLSFVWVIFAYVSPWLSGVTYMWLYLYCVAGMHYVKISSKSLHFHRWAKTKGTYSATYLWLPATWLHNTWISGTKYSASSEWFKKVLNRLRFMCCKRDSIVKHYMVSIKKECCNHGCYNYVMWFRPVERGVQRSSLEPSFGLYRKYLNTSCSAMHLKCPTILNGPLASLPCTENHCNLDQFGCCCAPCSLLKTGR